MAMEVDRKLIDVGGGTLYINVTVSNGDEYNIDQNGIVAVGHVAGTELGHMWLNDNDGGDVCTFGNQESATITWLQKRDDDCLEQAKAIFYLLKPITFAGLDFKDGAVTRVFENVYSCAYTFSNAGPQETTVCEVGFTTGGGTEDIKAGYQHLQSVYRSGSGPADPFMGAINVRDDNQVEGVTRVARRLQWYVKAYVPPSQVNFGYVVGLMNLTGTMNAAAFNGFAIGELLFLGANASGRAFRYMPITFEFLASPNVAGLSIGGLPPITKLGHDYFWVAFEEEDVGTTRLISAPESGHVERIYQFGNFGLLGLPC